jgi:hypothetical protein
MQNHLRESNIGKNSFKLNCDECKGPFELCLVSGEQIMNGDGNLDRLKVARLQSLDHKSDPLFHAFFSFSLTLPSLSPLSFMPPKTEDHRPTFKQTRGHAGASSRQRLIPQCEKGLYSHNFERKCLQGRDRVALISCCRRHLSRQLIQSIDQKYGDLDISGYAWNPTALRFSNAALIPHWIYNRSTHLR